MRPWWAFLGGYLLVWIGFAGVAAAAQLRLIDLDIIGHNGTSTSQVFSAIVLALAGAYQFTSLKRRCITECVNPMTYFLRHWRDGVVGGARMGVRHGVACLGCCWALMLLAFVGGIANIWFMALAAVVMAVEKVPAVSRFVTVPLGVVLIVASGVIAIAALTGGDGPHHPTDHQMSIARITQTKGIQ